MQLIDRTIVITGGTSGIGKALVEQLAPYNHHILVLARNSQKFKGIKEAFSNVSLLQCDLQNREQIRACCQVIKTQYPQTSILINNAAVQYTHELLSADFTFHSIEEEITVNLMAPIWLTYELLDHFNQQDNHSGVINLTSGLAIHPKTQSATYCATKAGLRSFTRSLRYQLDSRNISIFEMLLPLVDTAMTQGRGDQKMTADTAAMKIISAVQRDRYEAYIGKAKLIPWVNRLSVHLMAHILRTA